MDDVTRQRAVADLATLAVQLEDASCSVAGKLLREELSGAACWVHQLGRRLASLPLVLALVVLGGAACDASPCERPAGSWCVEGDAPAAFVAEVAAAAGIIGAPLGGAFAGTVRVEAAPFACGSVLAAGCLVDARTVVVVYAPELGLGPEVGSTALEHELCHAAGWRTEEGATAYASAALPAIRAQLEGVDRG